VFCSNCGHEIQQDAKFCVNCGKAISTTAGPPPVPVSTESATPRDSGRGGLILTMGILSIVFLWIFTGIPAWVMGKRDLTRIRRGEISPNQKGLTQSGMILGILGTFLSPPFIALVLAILTVATTVLSFSVLNRGRAAQNLAPTSPNYLPKEAGLTYTDSIEQIRGQTADETPSIFLLKVSIGFDTEDKQVGVEIGQRNREIQDLLLSYVSNKTANELSPAHYDEIKAEMVNLINRLMTTGKIKKVMFREISVVK
jgi:flagellar basal body-associated protein FliL